MNEEKRLDLSALDPMGDPDRWNGIVEATLARVDRVLIGRSPDPLTLIASWTRALTAGVVVMIGLLVPVEILLENREARREQVERLVQLSAETIRGDGRLTGADLVHALGSGEAR